MSISIFVKSLFLLLCLTFGLFSASQAQFQEISLSGNPVDVTGWTLKGFAQVQGDHVLICPAQDSRSGSIFYNTPIDPSKCKRWEAEFEFRIFDGDEADGIAFCFLANPPQNATGGGGIGIPTNPNGILVVLDQWDNCGQPLDELQLRYSDGSINYNECTPQPTVIAEPLRSNSYRKCIVTYNNGAINISIPSMGITLSGNYTPTFTAGYFGFTASTGAGNDNHSIRNVKIRIIGVPRAEAGPDKELCSGGTPVGIGFVPCPTACPDTTYFWTPTTGLSNANIPNPTITLTNGTNAVQNFNYIITAVSGTGCENKDTVKITVNPKPPNPVFPNVTTCAGQNVLLQPVPATPGYVYNFYSNPNLTGLLASNVPGFSVQNPQTTTTIYVETVNQSANCPGGVSVPITVTVSPAPAPFVAVPQTICNGGTASIDAPAGFTINVYTTANGGTPLNPTPVTSFATPPLTTSTEYFVEVIGTGGCNSATRTSVFITVNGSAAPTAPVANAPNPSFVCPGGTSLLSAPAPGGGLTLKWYTQAAGGTAFATGNSTVVPPSGQTLADTTTYFVESSSGGCAGPRTAVTVNVPEPLPVPEVLPISLCGSPAPTQTPVVIENFADFPSGTIFKIYQGATSTVVATGTTSPMTINSGATQSYTIEATFTYPNGTSCSSVKGTFQVSVTAAPPQPTSLPAPNNGPYTICSGSEITLTVQNPQPNTTYEWVKPPSTILATNDTITFIPIAAGVTGSTQIQLRARLSGQCFSSRLITFTANIGINAPSIQTQNVCASDSGIVTLAPTTGGAGLQWFATQTGGSPLATSLTFPVNMDTITGDKVYYISSYNGPFCNNPVRVPYTLKYNPNPEQPIPFGVSPVCKGTAVTLEAVLISGGAGNFRWFTSPTGSVAGTGTTFSPNTNTSGTFIIYVDNFNATTGCASAKNSFELVVEEPTPTPTIAAQTICAGQKATLTPSPSDTYTWYKSSDPIVDPSGFFIGSSYTTTALTADTTIFVKNNGSQTCPGTRVGVTITVNQVPAMSPTASPASLCPGVSSTLSVTPSSGVSYVWNPGGLSGATVNVTPLATTTYTVTATKGTCTATATVTVTLNNNLTVAASTLTPTICVGSSATLTATGATNYLWTPGNFSGASVLVAPAATTTYTVVGTDASGCTGSSTILLTVSSNPTPTVSGTLSYCAGGSTSLTASGATNFSWSPNIGLSATTGATVTANPAATTTYTVVGTTGTCTGQTTFTVVVNPKPIVAVSPQTYCVGGSATLTATGASTYAWTPATGLSASAGSSVVANPSSTTTYTVTGTAANGCLNTTTVVVTVINPTQVTASSNVPNNAICAGTNQVVALTAAGGATATYAWTPTAGLTPATGIGATVTTSPTATTTYTVVATENGCTTSTTITITVNPLPTITLSNSSVSICIGQSSTVTVVNPQANTTYTWNANANLLVNANGTQVVYTPPVGSVGEAYTVTATNTLTGCSQTAVLNFNITTAQGLTVNKSPNGPLCSNGTYTLTASGSAGTYSWSPATGLSSASGSPVTVSFFPGLTQIYTVTGTDCGGLAISNTVSVTFFAEPTVAVDAPSSVCSGDSKTLNVINAAFPAVNYIWTGTGISPTTGNTLSLTNLTTSGTYTVTLTDVNGCVVSASTSVTVNPLPTPTISTLDPTTICPGSGAVVNLTVTPNSGAIEWFRDTGTAPPPVLVGNGAAFAATDVGDYFAVVTDANGCVGQSNILTVSSVAPIDPVNVASDPFCEGDNYFIEVQNSQNGVVYQLLDQNGATVGGTVAGNGGAIQMPVPSSLVVLGTNASVTVNLKLRATTNTTPACTSDLANLINLKVLATPVAPVVPASIKLCNSVAQDVSAANTPAYPVTYEWFDAPTGGTPFFTGTTYTVSGDKSPVYVQAVNYDFGGSFGCVSPRVKIDVVNNVVQKPADQNLILCEGSNTTVDATIAGVSGYVYNWYTLPNGITPFRTDPTFEVPPGQTFYVEAEVDGCKSAKATISVTFTPKPTIADHDTVSVCPNNPYTIFLPDQPNVDYLWYNSPNSTTPFFTGDIYNGTGDSTTTLYVEAAIGNCKSDKKIAIPVVLNPVPLAVFSYPEPVVAKIPVTFTPQLLGLVTTIWELASGETSDQYQFTHIFPLAGEYELKFTVGNFYGCVNDTTVKITVIEPNIQIPNVFSPNGDGINETLNPLGIDQPQSFEFKIFDRWGVELTTLTDYTKGWDGTIKGSKAAPGLYFYLLKVTLSNGKEVLQNGTCTLVR